VAQLRQNYDRIQDMGADIVVVSFGAGLLARRWLEETKAPFTLLLDPRREAYKAYHLDRSLLRSWNLNTFLRYVRLLLSGYRWRGIQGDSAQLGGDFIVDRDGIIRLAWPSRDPTDRPSIDDILNALKSMGDH
jgi:peroxiredoxin